MAKSPFDELAEKYDSWYETKGKLAFAIELEALRPLLEELPRPWLEVGVGSGRFARALGIDTGVDPAAGLLRIARQRGIDTIRASGEALPFADRTLGTVFLLATWEFLKEPVKVLKEIHRVLQDGGKLVNAYLDKEGKWGRSYIEKGKQGHPLFSSARFYGYEEVVELITGAGFKRTRTVSTLFQGPGETVVMEEPRQGFHPGASFVVIVAEKVGP